MSAITLTSTLAVELVQAMGSDAMIVHAARVSTRGNAAREDVADADGGYGLISYLMKHKHGSVFEHGSMTFFVRAPIFVWREWHRHRVGFAYSDYGLDDGLGQSFNEESGRYKTLEPEFYIPPRDRPMMKVEGWRPGRPKFLTLDQHFEVAAATWIAERRLAAEGRYKALSHNLRESYELAYRNYERNLALGIDPGLARDCLPVGIMSSCWVTTNPRALMHFLSLRTSDAGKSYPLWEIEQAAKQCEELFRERWPLTHKAFNECGRVAP